MAISIFKKRQSKGRQKVEIKKIEKEEARQICFSKRKAGIFKKANELAILCGAEVGIVTFSPAGRAFSFGHPNIHSLINRYLPAGKPSTTEDLLLHHPEPSSNSYFHGLKLNELQREHERLLSLVDAVKKQQQEIKGRLWWDVDIEGLGLEDLINYVKVLDELKFKILNITAAKSVLHHHHHHPCYSLVHDSGSVEDLSLHANNVLSGYSPFDGFNERFGWSKGQGVVPAGCSFVAGFDDELKRMEGLHANGVNGFDQRQVNIAASLHGGHGHMGFLN